jgi:ATP-dependent Clp protease ATP-binding subunit ClpA
MWERLSPAAVQVIDLAASESRQLGHGYIGDEHVILGLLRGQPTVASSLLHGHGLTLAGARAELRRLATAGQLPQAWADDVGALQAIGIDVNAVRKRLTEAFGAATVEAAVWRASRRPWWRGGGRRRTPLCGPPFLAKRALHLAFCYADGRGAAAVTPDHLLYGVLRDLDDPLGTQLSGRACKQLSRFGWEIGTINPASAVLRAHGIDPARLRGELDRTPEAPPR